MVTTADGDSFLHGDITHRTIGAYYAVYNTLRPGLLEPVYMRAMRAELRFRGLQVRSEVPYRIHYRGELIGEYRADLVVDETLIVECKAVERLLRAHSAQLLNYLNLSGLSVGLLLNFGPHAEIRRLARSSPGKSISSDPP